MTTKEAKNKPQDTNAKEHEQNEQAASTSTSSFLLEVPMVRIILFHWLKLGNILEPVGRSIARIRWLLAPPLQTRILPRCLLASCGGPLAPTIQAFDWTVGELILAAPLVIWSLLCLHYSIGDDSIKSVNESGHFALYGVAYTFLTANKSNSIFAIVFGVPFDRLVSLHRLASIATLGMSFCHAYVTFDLYNGKTIGEPTENDQGEVMLRVEVDETWAEFLFQKNTTNLMGAVVVIFTIALIVTSYFGVLLRTYAYQTWFAMHIIMVVGILIGLWMHVGAKLMLLFISLWWGADIIFRYILPRILQRGQVCGEAELRLIGVDLNATSSHRLPHEPAVELLISPKPFDYMPGQFIKICIPSISMWEYHSVTISSAPQEADGLTVHFRALGDWTEKLAELAKSTSTTKVWLEGPYGALSFDMGNQIGQRPPSTDINSNMPSSDSPATVQPAASAPSLTHRPKIFVLVSGGIGVTPCQSLGKYLMYQQQLQGPGQQPEFKLIKFVWAVRSTSMVDDIPPLAVQNADHGKPDSVVQDAETGSASKASGFPDREVEMKTLSSQAQPAKHSAESQANVEVDIYRTRMESEENQSEGQHKIQKQDCYNMTTKMHAGRPDLDEILKEVKREAVHKYGGETSIAVLGCGPRSLMHDLQLSCRKHGASIVGGCANEDEEDVFIDLHIESFCM